MKAKFIYLLTVFTFLCQVGFTQNEAKKWYFGSQAGLDFMTSPPTILTNGVMNTSEGCASIANAAGNLLFYTDGITIWNQTHVAMANGTGLMGNSSTTQSGVIVKQPGNANIYFVFTLDLQGGGNGFRYSIVDMNLAAGMGSVTVKNVLIYSPCCEKLTAVRHCNGTDIWIVTHDYGTNQFRANLLSTAGINPVYVVSAVGIVNTGANGSIGYLKVSPNGKKLGLALYGYNSFELYDFDAATGLVSNPFVLGIGYTSAYGCEFSPDGTKFYGSRYSAYQLIQWNLCAGSNTAIAASEYTMSVGAFPGAIQLGPNGKIYVTRELQQTIGVINNPNASGAACGYVDLGQSIAPKSSQHGLPNFVSSYFKPPSPPFTHTVSNVFGCQTASYNAPPTVQNPTLAACGATSFSLMGILWNFGDPSSGAANTSTLLNPFHGFSALGTYTTQLILYYSCGGGTDTLKQQVNINLPCISVTSTSITCASLGSATVVSTGGVGPFSYTWTPSGQSGSVATGLSPGAYTLTVFDAGNNLTYTAMTVFTSLVPLTGSLVSSPSVTCNGANTGTATITNLAGGSGTQNYLWSNGVSTYTTAFTNSLTVGLWSLTVTDALTGCTINQQFIIAQPSALALNVVASTPTTCVGTGITFTATNSGGTPGAGYTYTWTGGPQTATYTSVQTLANNYVYTVSSRDANNCSISQTISADFVANPPLTVTSAFICPQETATLIASGATTYTWNGISVGNTFVMSPLITSQYTVVGEALSCTASATSTITLKTVPVPVFSSNSPICNGQNLVFSVSSGTAAIWTGVGGFTSSNISNIIVAANPGHSGAYQVTVTAANSCTASTSGNVTVHPTPILSATGSTVCVNQILQLNSNSNLTGSYLWTGPGGYTSFSQNPSVNNPLVSASGNYTVKATSTQGCTNTAFANVTVTPLPVAVFSSNSPKCSGQTLSFNSQGTTGALIYSWSGPNGFNSVSQNPNIPFVTVPASGDYTLTVTSGPCVVSVTHPATIHPLPSPVAFNTGPACETKSVQIGVNNSGLTYVWTGPGSFASNQTGFSISNLNSGHSGNYMITVTDANGCEASSITSLTVLFNPIIYATGELVCFGQPAQLNVIGANSYYWFGPGNFTSLSTNPIVAPAINTNVWTYTVVGTAVNGCTAITTATIGTKPLPVPGLTVTPRLCVNSEIKLQGEGGTFYEWKGPLNFYSLLQNPVVVALNVGMGGTYSLTVTDGVGCKGYTTGLVQIDDEPSGKLNGDIMEGCVPFCSGYTLQTISSSTFMNVSWLINNQVFNGNSFSYCFNTSGNYTVASSFEDSHNCKATAYFTIRVFEKPQADFEFSPLTPVENEDEVLFINTSTGTQQNKWHWAFINDWAYISGSKNISYLFEEAGIYAVAMVVTNSWGCSDTILKAIEVLPDFHVYIPNTFTPNNDGLNETFFPVMRGVRNYKMQIYDRWGTEVFASKDPSKTWDGTFKGVGCKTDTYNYSLVLISNTGEEKKYYGAVLLLK